MRIRVVFFTSTDTKEVERVDRDRIIETTLWLSDAYVDVLRTFMDSGQPLAAYRVLDEPVKDQYIGEEVHVTVTEIQHPERRDGTDFMLTPTSVE